MAHRAYLSGNSWHIEVHVTDPSSPSARPHPRLVIHDLQLTRIETAPGKSSVVATVECEHHQCTRTVEDCVKCERFARIEVHEAGYTMVCHSADLDTPPADAFEAEEVGSLEQKDDHHRP